MAAPSMIATTMPAPLSLPGKFLHTYREICRNAGRMFLREINTAIK